MSITGLHLQETLEQYEVFKEYVKILETHLDKFASKQGFATTKECFDLINKSVADDLIAVRTEIVCYAYTDDLSTTCNYM